MTRLAAIQICCEVGDIDANVTKMVNSAYIFYLEGCRNANKSSFPKRKADRIADQL